VFKKNQLTEIHIKCKTNIASSLLKGIALDVEEARVVVAGLVSSVGRVPVC